MHSGSAVGFEEDDDFELYFYPHLSKAPPPRATTEGDACGGHRSHFVHSAVIFRVCQASRVLRGVTGLESGVGRGLVDGKVSLLDLGGQEKCCVSLYGHGGCKTSFNTQRAPCRGGGQEAVIKSVHNGERGIPVIHLAVVLSAVPRLAWPRSLDQVIAQVLASRDDSDARAPPLVPPPPPPPAEVAQFRWAPPPLKQ